MRNIVVGFGTHAHSTKALEWGTQLGSRTGARVTVLSVFHPAYIEMSPTGHAKSVAEQRSIVEAALAKGSGHRNVDIVVESGEAVEWLLRYSARIGADLIVVGRHGSMAPGGFGERGAAESLLHSSHIPFLVVGDKADVPSLDSPLTMVVGVDGSHANADSVAAIADLAVDLEATAIPVLAVNTGASTTRDHHGSTLLHQSEAEAVAARLPGQQALRTMNESPVQGLLDAAEEHDADLIAIGTRGHWTLGDLFAGQITRHVIEHAKVPVLIAPHPEG